MTLREFLEYHGLNNGLTILEWMGVKDLATAIVAELADEKEAELATSLLTPTPTISTYLPSSNTGTAMVLIHSPRKEEPEFSDQRLKGMYAHLFKANKPLFADSENIQSATASKQPRHI